MKKNPTQTAYYAVRASKKPQSAVLTVPVWCRNQCLEADLTNSHQIHLTWEIQLQLAMEKKTLAKVKVWPKLVANLSTARYPLRIGTRRYVMDVVSLFRTWYCTCWDFFLYITLYLLFMFSFSGWDGFLKYRTERNICRKRYKKRSITGLNVVKCTRR